MIPEMTDPLGKHWNQPKDMTSVEMDDKHALLTPLQYEMLHEYSSTIPTGVYPGKCWKRLQSDGWLLAWFEEVPTNPKLCSIHFREILIA